MAHLEQFSAILLLLATCCTCETIKDTKKNEHVLDRSRLMSLQAQQTLFDEMGRNGLEQIKEAVPLYRQDLPSNYIAYWLAEYDDKFVVVSSGSQTGDREILKTGDIPSPVSLLRDKAGSRGHMCVKFYVLTSTGDMACSDGSNKFVAINIPENVILPNVTSSNVTVDMIDRYIKSKSEEQAAIWKAHARRIKKKTEGDIDEDLVMLMIRERISAMPSSIRHQLNNTAADFRFQARFITPGRPVEVVTGDSASLSEVRIRYVMTGSSAYGRVAGLKEHQRLCRAVKGCISANQNYALLSLNGTQPTATTVNIELDEGTKKIFKGEEFVLAVDIVDNDGMMTSRHFAVEYGRHRQKRSSSYSSWSEWSIGEENLFPDYDQFTYDGCAVGCGPVAWAMVFGYYDRRSELSSRYSGSENLYRSGSDGTTGSSSEVAPAYMGSDRIERYISNLNELLGTFCFFDGGATPHFFMDDIEGFFKARQTRGSPRIEEKSHWLSWAGIYNDDVENWVMSKVKAGWPVIVGWRSDGYLGWHYPVATKVRVRTRTYKSCFLWWCSTKTSTEKKMYLHMGWGGYGNDWKYLEAYYAVTAVY